jgi:hypothetical protein
MSVSTINGTTQIRDNTVTPAKVTSGIIKADGTNAFAGDQDLGGFKLTGLGAPTNPNDAATKTYVDTAVTGVYDLKGSTDCSANPNYPAASKGFAYVVTVAGKIGGASGVSVDVGDMYFATADNAGGTQASVGASWSVLEHNLVGALLSANNLSDLASASTARTNLGATTAGGNIFTVTNPSAITFLRVNADNSVTLLSASAFRTAIGATGGTNVTRETPSGTVNGSNVTFTLANTPVSGSESVFVNGILQDSGAGNDYTISSGTITFLTGAIPQTGDKVRVSYTY